MTIAFIAAMRLSEPRMRSFGSLPSRATLEQRLVAAADYFRVSANQHHVFAGKKGPHHRRFDFTVSGDGAHLEIVSHDEMLITQFSAQQVGDDVVAERCRLEQTAGDSLSEYRCWENRRG